MPRIWSRELSPKTVGFSASSSPLPPPPYPAPGPLLKCPSAKSGEQGRSGLLPFFHHPPESCSRPYRFKGKGDHALGGQASHPENQLCMSSRSGSGLCSGPGFWSPGSAQPGHLASGCFYPDILPGLLHLLWPGPGCSSFPVRPFFPGKEAARNREAVSAENNPG